MVCRDCGVPAPVRSSRWRRFIHTPLGKAGVHLLVHCRRYECRGCGGAWEDDLSRVAADGRRLTEAAVWWAVASVVLDAMSVRSVAMTLGLFLVKLVFRFGGGDVLLDSGVLVL